MAAADARLAFTPQHAFAGESEGNGSLKMLLGDARAFHVESHGSEQRDATLRLEQRVTFQGEPGRDRVWIITPAGPGQYAGTLTDAAGPVSGCTSGARLSLRYRVKGPFVMHQELELMPDGKTIDNAGVITFLGVPVGHLHETITRASRPH